MKRRHALPVAIAAVLGALAIFALPALAGAVEDHHGHGHDDSGEHRNHHGSRDRHANVGKISAFDASNGELTIARFRGGSISGLVTSATEIRCEGRDDNSARFSRDSGSSGSGSSGSGSGEDNSGPGSGDDNGRGEAEPGDDNGQGVEPGDDNGGRGEAEPGDDHSRGEDGDRHDNGHRLCTTADLTVGTVVHDVDRDFAGGVASFDEIELAHSR